MQSCTGISNKPVYLFNEVNGKKERVGIRIFP